MIAYLKGQVKNKDDKSLLLVTGDVGYQVFVPEYVLLQVKEGAKLELFMHEHFSTREETISLYGFLKMEELDFFEQLIDVSGVGRRSALAALSVAKVEELRKTISREDPALLQKVAGIGKKTAERIVVELKDKIFSESASGATLDFSSGDGEVIGALEGLGYNAGDIREVIRRLPPELNSSEDRIKAALKMLGKN
jgi:holliday junction DNA helicase RuvA